eukprot:PITA_15502
MVSAINDAPKGYKSPGYDKARTVGLDHEKAKISHSLNRMTSSWTDHGVSIVSDGWTNVKGKPLISVIAVSVSGAIFLNAYDYSEKFKTGINIAEALLETIDHIAPYNVIQVITDNAPNCKSAGAIIEDKYPNIFWFGCLVHTLNLLRHDVVKNKNEQYKWIGDLYKKGKQMIKFITNHSNTHGLFRSHLRLELLKIARTRFGSYYLTFRRLLKMDTMLGQIKDIVYNNDPDLYKLIHDCVCVRWNKLNLSLHCLAYILTTKYYSTSWLGQPAPGGGVRTKPHIDEEVSKGYLEALENLILDREECASVRLEIGRYISGTERCWSTYNFINNVKRNRLNENRVESLVYVHYNLRLLSHYCDRAYEDPTYKIWDNHSVGDNLEDGTIHLEELEEELIREEDEAAAMAPPPSSSSARVPSLVPLLSPPPSIASRGGHVPSSSGRRPVRETPRRPPRLAHTVDSRGKGHMQ